MRIKFVFLFLVLGFLVQLDAQVADQFEFSEIRKQRRSALRNMLPLPSGESLLLKSNESRFVTRLFSSSRMNIELLDENLNLKKTLKTRIQVSRSWASKDRVYRFAEVLNERVYIFYSIQKNRTAFSLYAVELDTETLSLARKSILVGDFDKKDNLDFGRVDMDISRNMERVVLYFRETVKEKKRTEHVEMVVLDKDLNRIWQRSVLRPADKKRSNYLDVTVNNAGEAFLLERTQTGNLISLYGNTRDFNFYIHKFDAAGEKGKRVEIKKEDKEISTLDLSFNFNEDLLALGFYTDRTASTRTVGGTVYYRFDTRGMRVEAKKLDPFDIDFITFGENDGKANRMKNRAKRGGISELNIQFRDVVYRSDGGAILIGEEYYMTRNTDEDGITTSYTHYYNDIILINLDASGQVVWGEKVLKRQALTTGLSRLNPAFGECTFASFSYAVNKDKISLFFNDHVNNTSLKEKRREVRPTPGTLRSNFCMVSVDQRGEMEKEILFYSKDNKVIFYPAFARAYDISRTELLFYGRYRKKERVARYSAEF
jgi:hypothetical protein